MTFSSVTSIRRLSSACGHALALAVQLGLILVAAIIFFVMTDGDWHLQALTLSLLTFGSWIFRRHHLRVERCLDPDRVLVRFKGQCLSTWVTLAAWLSLVILAPFGSSAAPTMDLGVAAVFLAAHEPGLAKLFALRTET